MKLYGLTLPWVKRNVIIFCRRAAFRMCHMCRIHMCRNRVIGAVKHPKEK